MKPFNLVADYTPYLPFNAQLNLFRKRQGWTIEQLSKRLGLTTRRVASLLSGEDKPASSTLRILFVLKDHPAYFDEIIADELVLPPITPQPSEP